MLQWHFIPLHILPQPTYRDDTPARLGLSRCKLIPTWLSAWENCLGVCQMDALHPPSAKTWGLVGPLPFHEAFPIHTPFFA